ncbi:hypothetical protein, partial [Paeniglutamicibacter sulfureus]|uniref:hypothetical protein n=1 Tax=Paeniglutamicibacter sulfureus TaxID=43666 RepID=UPI0035EB0DE0
AFNPSFKPTAMAAPRTMRRQRTAAPAPPKSLAKAVMFKEVKSQWPDGQNIGARHHGEVSEHVQ